MKRAGRISLLVLGMLLTGCAQRLVTDSDCAGFSDEACLSSAACTLDMPAAGEYRCRIAADHCESAFRQSESTPEQCEQRSNCVYAPGQCYCAPDVTCICGGGPPPMCTKR